MMIKMYTYDGYWVVVDGERLVPFKKSYDAWQFVFLLKEIRPRVPYVRPLYPVRSLSPIPERKIKKIVIN